MGCDGPRPGFEALHELRELAQPLPLPLPFPLMLRLPLMLMLLKLP
jgi:hypothetical protein